MISKNKFTNKFGTIASGLRDVPGLFVGSGITCCVRITCCATDLQYMLSQDYFSPQRLRITCCVRITCCIRITCFVRKTCYVRITCFVRNLEMSGYLLRQDYVLWTSAAERGAISGSPSYFSQITGTRPRERYSSSSCTTGINDTGGNLALVSTIPAVNLPTVARVSLIQVALSLESNVGCRQVQI
jgi:hypothetical protein